MKWVNILPGNSKTDPLSTQNFQLKFKKKKTLHPKNIQFTKQYPEKGQN